MSDTREIRGPFFRKAYPFVTTDRSRTKQSHKKECDVNEILKKFRDTGVIAHRNTFEGSYGDFTNVPQSYHEALEQLRHADNMFMTLPAHVREKFENSPAAFLKFVENPDNAQEMYDLGLTNSPPAKREEPKVPQTEPKAKSPASSERAGET